MSYIFQFSDDMGEDDGEDLYIWVTKKEFWDQNEHFDDQERGCDFPDPIKNILINSMEACFEWNRSKYSKEDIRILCQLHGWTEIVD